jgi:hypothetical protein
MNIAGGNVCFGWDMWLDCLTPASQNNSYLGNSLDLVARAETTAFDVYTSWIFVIDKGAPQMA